MVLISNISKNNISIFSRYNKWYSILQFKHGENNIAQYNFNFIVYDINDNYVILHSYDEIEDHIKRSMKISLDDAKLYISDGDLKFKECNYIVSPVKKENEIQIHIIDSKYSDRRVLVYTPEKTYSSILSIKDSINFQLKIENKSYSIKFNNKNKSHMLSEIKNNLSSDFSTEIIESNENIWNKFICADSSVGIRIKSHKKIQVNRNET